MTAACAQYPQHHLSALAARPQSLGPGMHAQWGRLVDFSTTNRREARRLVRRPRISASAGASRYTHEGVNPGFHFLRAAAGLRLGEHISPHRHVRLEMRFVAGPPVDELRDRVCRKLAVVLLRQLREICGLLPNRLAQRAVALAFGAVARRTVMSYFCLPSATSAVCPRADTLAEIAAAAMNAPVVNFEALNTPSLAQRPIAVGDHAQRPPRMEHSTALSRTCYDVEEIGLMSGRRAEGP